MEALRRAAVPGMEEFVRECVTHHICDCKHDRMLELEREVEGLRAELASIEDADRFVRDDREEDGIRYLTLLELYDRRNKPVREGSEVLVWMREDGSRRYQRCNGRTGSVEQTMLDTGSATRWVYRVAVEGVRSRYWFQRDELEALS